jgi:RNA polymerase sigma factor (TIGR02999 family)
VLDDEHEVRVDAVTVSSSDLTQLLQASADGDLGARDRAFELVYADLKRVAGRVARSVGPQHTLDTTGLVHESFMRLVDSAPSSREHFFALAARAMRQILCDHARRRLADKRGAGQAARNIDDVQVADEHELTSLVAIDDLFDKLAAADERAARTLELRVFAGLSVVETAEVLGVSARTVHLDVDRARSWLAPHLGG